MGRRRRPSSPAPAAPLEDDDLLGEILLRLPPRPSSLPRASLVCKRWRRLVSDRGFLARFRARHRREPPLLGIFTGGFEWLGFTPLLDPPDRIPAERLSLRQSRDERWIFCGCRHGLALLFNVDRLHAVVCDPLTGRQRQVAFPPGFDDDQENIIGSAGMLCAAREEGHVHGDCHSSPFKLVLVRTNTARTRVFARLYDSQSGEWGNLISEPITVILPITLQRSSVLVGSALHWSIDATSILSFDLETQRLALIREPADARSTRYSHFQILRTQDGCLGLAISSQQSMQLWERNTSEGVGRWVLRKTLHLDKLLPAKPGMEKAHIQILGYAEESNVMFLVIGFSVFMIQLDSLRFKLIFESNLRTTYHPYTNFYAGGRVIGGRDDEPKMLNNT
ncbi:uncharacterized protein LOC119352807 [Triticum dicoccoides]|uniref:uncharacterized protein LOC119352807 n=1 Tax=Triticum dicoccoides TaxID=85692 RepID=UPI00123364A4|nr:uncharacterized protein LOC119352807 [Triticum dicoccoides]